MRLLFLLLIFLLSACSNFKPQALDYSEVAVPNAKKPMAYGVYTPPNWQAEERLPLILLLHGGGGSHHSFERYGGHEYLDQKMKSGEISRAVVVTPNGNNGFWENWHDGSYQYRDWVLDYVVPKVIKDYNTLDCPNHCHLTGISMGGFGVMRFAYYASDRFSSVSAISAPIFTKEQAEKRKTSLLVKLLFPFDRIFGDYTDELRRSSAYNAWVEDKDLQALRLQIVWGDDDHKSIVESNQAFHKHLNSNGVPHEKFVYQGGHKWKYWIPQFDRVINFLLATPNLNDRG